VILFRKILDNETVPKDWTEANINVSVNVNQFFSAARIAELLRNPRRHSRVTELCWGRIVKKGMFLNVGGRRAETSDDWMSDGSEFQRSDTVTGNVRRPTVVSRNDETSS